MPISKVHWSIANREIPVSKPEFPISKPCADVARLRAVVSKVLESVSEMGAAISGWDVRVSRWRARVSKPLALVAAMGANVTAADAFAERLARNLHFFWVQKYAHFAFGSVGLACLAAFIVSALGGTKFTVTPIYLMGAVGSALLSWIFLREPSPGNGPSVGSLLPLPTPSPKGRKYLYLFGLSYGPLYRQEAWVEALLRQPNATLQVAACRTITIMAVLAVGSGLVALRSGWGVAVGLWFLAGLVVPALMWRLAPSVIARDLASIQQSST